MKYSLLMAAFALLAAFPIIAQAGEKDIMSETKSTAEDVMEKPAIQAVVFYSDTCGSCKILEPRMESAMAIINPSKVEAVKFDFSNSTSTEATKILAANKNVSNVLNQYGARTGFVVLVNGQGDVVDTIKVDHDTAEIAAKLATAVANAS